MPAPTDAAYWTQRRAGVDPSKRHAGAGDALEHRQATLHLVAKRSVAGTLRCRNRTSWWKDLARVTIAVSDNHRASVDLEHTACCYTMAWHGDSM